MTATMQTTLSGTAEPKTNPRRKGRHILMAVVAVIVGLFVYPMIFPSPQTRALQRVHELGGYASGQYIMIDPFSWVGLRRPTFVPRIPMKKRDVIGFVVEGKAVTDRDVEMFCAAFPLAEQADLSSTPVSSDGFLPLASLPKLWRLLARHTRADDRLLDVLSSPNLQILELDGTQVTDAGVGRFLSSRTGISQLHLSNTVVTDQTCIELAKLKQIFLVDLTSTRVTAAGVELLQAAHPQCKIIWGGPKSVTNSE
jgi:hypothetical protein